MKKVEASKNLNPLRPKDSMPKRGRVNMYLFISIIKS